MKKYSALLLISSLFFLFSCMKEEVYEDVYVEDYEPSVAFQLINADMTLQDIVENLDKSEINVTEDSDGLYVFYYKDTTITETAGTYLQIPDQAIHAGFGLNSSEYLEFTSFGNVSVPIYGSYTMNFSNNDNITEIDFRSGTLNIQVQNDFAANVGFVMNIPSFTHKVTNQPLVISNNNVGAGTTIPIDLSDYRVDLTDTNTTTNTVVYDGSINVQDNGGTVTSLDSLTFDFSFQNIRFRYMEGNIASLTTPMIGGDVELEIFKDLEEGNIYFGDISLSSKIVNSFGIPVELDIQQLDAETDYGQVTSITSAEISSPIQIPYPATRTSPPESYTLTLDKNNSNIVDALNPAPARIKYQIIPTIGNGGSLTNFVHDTSRVRIYSEARIPMAGWVRTLSITDTIFDIELPDREYIESATMKIKIENKLPVNVDFQMYMVDSNDVILDSLFSDPSKRMIISGPVNASGKVISSHTEYTEITVDTARYNKIADTDYMILTGNLETPDNPTQEVKFFSFNGMHVQVSFVANARVNLNEQ